MAAVNFASDAVGGVITGGKDLLAGTLATVGIELFSRDNEPALQIFNDGSLIQTPINSISLENHHDAITAAVAACKSLCTEMKNTNPADLFNSLPPAYVAVPYPQQAAGVGAMIG